MEPQDLQNKIDAIIPNDAPYVFAAFDPATGRMLMIRRGDLGICTTMQMHIAAHIVDQLQQAAAPPDSLINALKEAGAKDNPLMRPASEN